jgi:hypothetical protein
MGEVMALDGLRSNAILAVNDCAKGTCHARSLVLVMAWPEDHTISTGSATSGAVAWESGMAYKARAWPRCCSSSGRRTSRIWARWSTGGPRLDDRLVKGVLTAPLSAPAAVLPSWP